MKMKIQKRQAILGLLMIAAGLSFAGMTALHFIEKNRYSDVPLRSILVPHLYPRAGQSVQGLCFLPDSRTLVAADTQTGLSFWSLPQLKCERHIEHCSGDYLSSIYWIGSKNRVILSDAGGVSQWNARFGSLVKISTNQVDVARDAAKKDYWNVFQRHIVAPSGQFAANFDAQGDVSVWNILTGYRILKIDALPVGRNGYPIDFCDIAFSPDDRYVATALVYGDDSVGNAPVEIAIRDLRTGHILKEWQWKKSHLLKTGDSSGGNLENTGLTFSSDSKLLATADSNTVAVWEAQTGMLQQLLVAPLPANIGACGGKKRLVFFDKNHLLASVGWGDAVPVWNVGTGTLEQVFHADSYTEALAASPDNHYLATGGQTHTADGRIELWDVSRLLR